MPSMSVRKLLHCLSRRRFTPRAIHTCTSNHSHTHVLSNDIGLGHVGRGAAPNYDSCQRKKECHTCVPHQMLFSVCPDRIASFDEGSETCIHHQEDLHGASEDQVTHGKAGASIPPKRKRAKGVRKLKEEVLQWSPGNSTFLGDQESLLGETKSEKGADGNAHKSTHTGAKKDQGQRQGESKNGASVSKSGNSKKERDPKNLDFSNVEQVFQVLCIPKQSGLQKYERDSLARVFKHFFEAGWASKQALQQCYISAMVFPMAVSRFRKFFFSRSTPEIQSHLLQLGPSAAGDQFLLPLFCEFSRREFPGEVARYKALVETADLTKPHTWFPFARAMKRKVIYHVGPTNSGKTYNALERFKKASPGLYSGPLRLLAMEVYDTVNADGVYCSLITGQEKKEVPFAKHVSCTVEMVPLLTHWEVAIIDEIQMLTDDYRGWAWTRAFLGLRADELHLCGDPSALTLVSQLCAVTGDDLEQHAYERFEPLSIDEKSLEGKYANIKPGDCIVSFSRKDIFSIKRAVEIFTGNRCCVIYGALPPETRTHQAKLFNDPNSGYDVLVATDAVGMGLNLCIRRVVFYSFDKYNGDMVIKVSASQVKQIAGRAGRRGTLYHNGFATTFFSRDIPYLVTCMQEPFVESSSAGLFPTNDQIELFASQLPEATFSMLLDRFAETCQIEGAFFLCRNDNLKKIASIIEKVKDLTLEDKMTFILAPANSRNAKVVGALLSFALAYSKKIPVHLAIVSPTGSATSVMQLMDLETRHHVLSLYLWLSQHFSEDFFPQREQAEKMAADIALTLGESLAQTGIGTGETHGQQRSFPSKRGTLHLRTRRSTC